MAPLMSVLDNSEKRGIQGGAILKPLNTKFRVFILGNLFCTMKYICNLPTTTGLLLQIIIVWGIISLNNWQKIYYFLE